MIKAIHGDCLDVMPTLEAGSIDLVLCDLPYGVTACRWDTIIPFDPLWAEYRRLLKPRGAVVMTASQPFTSMLVMSNPKWFKYELIWDKKQVAAPGVAKFRPLPIHENIVVFASGRTTYNPVMGVGEPFKVTTHSNGNRHGFGFAGKRYTNENHGTRFPTSITKAKKVRHGLHETQKPVALMEYLIRTYSNEGETVLDNAMGSGTTLVACLNTNRNGIGIEKDAGIFETATNRLDAAQAREPLFA